MQQLKYILKFLLSLINESQQTWNSLKDENANESKLEYMQTNYYLPMMGVVALLIFVLVGWGSPFDIEHAMKDAVSFLAAFFLSPYLANVVLRKAFAKFMNITFDKEKLQVFISYSLSYLMLVRLFTATFPHIKFLTFCSLYIFYIVWSASDVYMGVPEKNRWKFTAMASIAMLLSPIVVEEIMSLMIR